MNQPRVGVAVFVIKDAKILMGKRKNAHAAGTWGLPGGHLEFGEDLVVCVQREALEEAGITLKNIRPASFTNDVFVEEQKHYITIFMVAEYAAGEVCVGEPEKCERWEWFTWEALPSPCMLGINNLKKTNFNPHACV